jgi:hypothetical protein
MSSFSTKVAAPTATEPDPTKHVNYTLGMILGVDDFKQEFAYLSGRDQWMARDLIGYGTVSGLRVTYDEAGGAPEIVVSAGVALSPRGQKICVPTTQCALLQGLPDGSGADSGRALPDGRGVHGPFAPGRRLSS